MAMLFRWQFDSCDSVPAEGYDKWWVDMHIDGQLQCEEALSFTGKGESCVVVDNKKRYQVDCQDDPAKFGNRTHSAYPQNYYHGLQHRDTLFQGWPFEKNTINRCSSRAKISEISQTSGIDNVILSSDLDSKDDPLWRSYKSSTS